MTEKLPGLVYLVPLPIGDDSLIQYRTEFADQEIKKIKYWIAENARTLRRYISSLKLGIVIDELEIFEHNHRGKEIDLIKDLNSIPENEPIGVVSEAGLPCIADPGHRVVLWAHRNERILFPMVGPNAVITALQASGLSGQKFIFHGYSPVKEGEWKAWIQTLQNGLWRGYAHSFIETPYRTDKTFSTLLRLLPQETSLTMAVDLHGTRHYIKTQTVKNWKMNKKTWGKVPVTWVIGF
jgi:16S rRNA (cytidine1402-2'-O)-methyltransferase